LLSVFPLTRLRILHLGGIHPSSSPNSAWQTIFCALQELRVLTIDECSGSWILDALTPSQLSGTSSEAWAIPLPSLQTLQLTMIRFDAGGYILGNLKDALIARDKAGAERPEIQFRDCYNLGSQNINKLEEIVDAVVWDNVVRDWDGECSDDEGCSDEECGTCPLCEERFESSQVYDDYDEYEDLDPGYFYNPYYGY
jgi:hypothetical protein